MIVMKLERYLVYKEVLSPESLRKESTSYLFPGFLKKFTVLLPLFNNNVYQTLEATLPYMEEPLKGKLEKLIREIGVENRLESYMEFAKWGGTSASYRILSNIIMDKIYEVSLGGYRVEALKELVGYVQVLNENHVRLMINEKMSELEYECVEDYFVDVEDVNTFFTKDKIDLIDRAFRFTSYDTALKVAGIVNGDVWALEYVPELTKV